MTKKMFFHNQHLAQTWCGRVIFSYWEQTATYLRALFLLALTTGIFFAGAAQPATALTIIRKYIPPGESFEFVGSQVNAGQVPTNTVGGGDVVSVFNAAADAWERAIKDDHTVTIQFGWSPIPLGGGVHNILFQGGIPNRVTDAIVYFDNDGSTVWFLDPTPHEHSEYPAMVECYATLGGTRINSGRVLSDRIGSTQALDFLTIAKHEIGHTLGLSTWNYLWVTKHAEQGIHVNAPRPFPGSVIPISPDGHLSLHGALMEQVLLPGQRKLISVVDVLAIAEMGEFIDLNFNPDEHTSATPRAEKMKAPSDCNPLPPPGDF